jgi:general stress protein YciG
MAEQDTQQDGRGWYGDSEGHAEAGRQGGEKVAQERGKEFYEDIGSEGGQASPGQFKADDERTREAGRKGGEN